MRITLRLIPVLTIVSLVGGYVLLDVANNTGSDTSPWFAPSLLVILLAFALTVVTFILGIVATATQRQFGWLIVVLAAGLVPLVGGFVASSVASAMTPVQQTLPTGCKPPPGTPVPPGCQGPPPSPGATVNFLNAVYPDLLLAAPILVALVVFIYSFRMRTALTPAGVHRS